MWRETVLKWESANVLRTVPVAVLVIIAALDSADKALLGASFPMLSATLGLHGTFLAVKRRPSLVRRPPRDNNCATSVDKKILSTFSFSSVSQSIRSGIFLSSQTCRTRCVYHFGAGWYIVTRYRTLTTFCACRVSCGVRQHYP